MALLHFDSFNYSSTADYLTYLYTLGNSPTIAAEGRNGTNCVALRSYQQLLYMFSSLTDITVGFAIKISNIGDIAKQLCTIGNSTLGHQVQVYKEDYTGKVLLYVGNTLVATSTLELESSIYYFIEVSVHIANTGGTLTCYVDGEEWVSYSGDTQARTANTAQYVQFFNNNVNFIYIDDLYVASGLTMLGDCSIDKVLPTSNGTYTQWDASAGTNYETIDESTQDGDTSYNSTSTDSEKDSFNLGDSASGISIYGIRILLFARKDDVDAHVIRPFVIIGGTTYYGDNISVADAYDYYEYVWENSPASTSAWTESEVNSAEFGYERVS